MVMAAADQQRREEKRQERATFWKAAGLEVAATGCPAAPARRWAPSQNEYEVKQKEHRLCSCLVQQRQDARSGKSPALGPLRGRQRPVPGGYLVESPCAQSMGVDDQPMEAFEIAGPSKLALSWEACRPGITPNLTSQGDGPDRGGKRHDSRRGTGSAGHMAPCEPTVPA